MSKAVVGRLILEASTGMHGEEAKILSDAWADMAQQRAELLEALKEAEARINDMLEGYDVHEALKEARKSLPRIKSTIAKAEAAE